MFFSNIKKLAAYRVKYLDREDIESLGFKFQKHWISENEGDIYNFKSYGLTWFKGTNKCMIWYNDQEGKNIFEGNIKNKSELKVLLKQLNINDI